LLAALPEYHALFRKVSRNPFLVGQGLKIDPDSVSIDELRGLGWGVIGPGYQDRLARLVEEFQQSKSRGLVGDHLGQIAFDAVSGRVMTLLVESDRVIPGHLDSFNGRIEFDDIHHPQVDDLIDDLAELVLNKGGQVVVVPADRMPTATGAAAIYRY